MMKPNFAVLWAFMCLSITSAWAIPVPESEISVRSGQVIRVRLEESAPRVQVRGFDLQFSEATRDPSVRWITKSKPQRMSEWSISCRGTLVQATRKNRSAGSSETLTLKSPAMVRTPAGFLTYEGRPFREEIRIYSRGRGCEIVNAVDLEKYLDGLVNSEFSSSWSEEAVAAQVVAARTYALFQMAQARRNPHSVHDLDATVKDQVYDGSVKEDFRASKAVSRTRGTVLVASNGTKVEPIKAFYHSTCGGTTELPGAVWGRTYPGVNRRVKCGYCYGSPRYEWETEFSADEIAEAIYRGAQRDGVPKGWPVDVGSLMKSGRLIGLTPVTDKDSGRVGVVQSFWRPAGRGGVQVRVPIQGALFRNWVGTLRLRSTQFRVVPRLTPKTASGLRFQFLGKGNGHGVGMCQWGAKVMGERGYKMAGILSHYYPGASLRKLW